MFVKKIKEEIRYFINIQLNKYRKSVIEKVIVIMPEEY
jgi:hypothetical protein